MSEEQAQVDRVAELKKANQLFRTIGAHIAYDEIDYLLSELDKAQQERDQLLLTNGDIGGQLVRMQGDNQKLIEGLKLYANVGDYVGCDEISPTVMIDKGKQARMILSELGVAE